MQQILSVFFISVGVITAAEADIGSHPPVDAAQLELQIHQQINRERQNHGLAPLDRDEKIADIARNHSRDMASGQFFSHTNLSGEGPGERGKKMGWDKKKRTGPDTWVTGLAENLVLNHLYDRVITLTENGVIVEKQYIWKTQEAIVQSTVREWMNSPSHRKNILSPQYDRQGIGVAISGDDIYVTEDLF